MAKALGGCTNATSNEAGKGLACGPADGRTIRWAEAFTMAQSVRNGGTPSTFLYPSTLSNPLTRSLGAFPGPVAAPIFRLAYGDRYRKATYG